MLKPQRLFLIAVIAALAGCATQPATTPAPQPDESRTAIASAVQRAASLPTHTAAAEAPQANAKMTGSDLSVNFAGDARTLLRQVAAARNLKFNVQGPQPHLPLFVIVDLKGATLESFLTDVGAQFGQRADLVLTGNSIEVRYRGQ